MLVGDQAFKNLVCENMLFAQQLTCLMLKIFLFTQNQDAVDL